MVEYYKQRASSAGLIITEGTSPSPNGLGYPRIPGIFSAAQVAGWKPVTDAVHAKGAKIFVQLMHTGRVGHPNNLPAGAHVLGAVGDCRRRRDVYRRRRPEAAPDAEGDDRSGHQDRASANTCRRRRMPSPPASKASSCTAPTVICSSNSSGPNSNKRTDAYGGSIENRARFVLEVVKATIAAIGKDKVGIRLSPFGVFNDMPLYPELEADYAYLARELNATGLLYVHLVDHSAMGAPHGAAVDQGDLP